MKQYFKTEFLASLLAIALVFAAACGGAGDSSVGTISNQVDSARQPVIEASPVRAGEGSYKIITGDTVKFTVNAADAQKVELYYRPVTAVDRALRLKTITEQTGGKFVSEMKVPADFNGDVWARAIYQNGGIKQTERLLLATAFESENSQNNQPGHANGNTNINSNSSVKQKDDPNGDNSERADKAAGGSIGRSKFQPNNPNIRISVNVPAFTMTLWQNGKEVAVYPVGVGLKEFPIPIGERTANKIILNPDWIPPDSEWVRMSDSVEPYERISADDPLNPLGKIKIPLGDAYLLHEAQSPSDIGNLVSHGCVRVLRDDIFELSKMISRALGLQVTETDFEKARNTSVRNVIDFENPIQVDINYDTMVVENGKLYIYPDVYDRKTNTVEELLTELREYGIDTAKIEKSALEKMIEGVSDDEKYVVALEDIRAGRMENGKTEPVVSKQTGNNTRNSNGNSSGT